MNFFRNLIFGSPDKAAPANRARAPPDREQRPANDDIANTAAHAAQRPSSFLRNDSRYAPAVPTDPSESIIPVVNTPPAPLNSARVVVEDEIRPNSRISPAADVMNAANPPSNSRAAKPVPGMDRSGFRHAVNPTVLENRNGPHTTSTVGTVGIGGPSPTPLVTNNAVNVTNSTAQANGGDCKENVPGNSEVEGDKDGESDYVEARVLYERMNQEELPNGEVYDFLRGCVRRRSQRRGGPANRNAVLRRPSSVRLIEKPPVSLASRQRHSLRHRPHARRASSNLFSLPFQRASVAGPSRPSSGVYGYQPPGSPERLPSENVALPPSENVGRPPFLNYGRQFSENLGRPSSMNFGRPSSANFSRPQPGSLSRPSSVNFGRTQYGNFSDPMSSNDGGRPSTDAGRPSSVRLGRLSSFNRSAPFVNRYGRSSLNPSLRRPVSLRTDSMRPFSSLIYRTSTGPSDPRYYEHKNPQLVDVPDSDRKDGRKSDYREMLDPATLARRKELEEMHRKRDEKIEQWRKRPRVRLIPPNIPPEKRRRIAGSFSQPAGAKTSRPVRRSSDAPSANRNDHGCSGDPSQPLGNANVDLPLSGRNTTSRVSFSNVAPIRAPDGTPLLTTQRKIVIPDDLDKRPKLIAFGCGEPRKSESKVPGNSTELVKTDNGKRLLDSTGEETPDVARARKMPRVSFAPNDDHDLKANCPTSESQWKNLGGASKSGSDPSASKGDGGGLHSVLPRKPSGNTSNREEPFRFPPDPSALAHSHDGGPRVSPLSTLNDAGDDDLTKGMGGHDFGLREKSGNSDVLEQRPKRSPAQGESCPKGDEEDRNCEGDVESNHGDLAGPGASHERSNNQSRIQPSEGKSSAPRSSKSPDPPFASNPFTKVGGDSSSLPSFSSRPDEDGIAVENKDVSRPMDLTGEETRNGSTAELGKQQCSNDGSKLFGSQPFSFPSTPSQFVFGGNLAIGTTEPKNSSEVPSELGQSESGEKTAEPETRRQDSNDRPSLVGFPGDSNSKNDKKRSKGPLNSDTFSTGDMAPRSPARHAVEPSDGKSFFVNGTQVAESKDRVNLSRNGKENTDNGVGNSNQIAAQNAIPDPVLSSDSALHKNGDNKGAETKSVELSNAQEGSHVPTSCSVLSGGPATSSSLALGSQGADGLISDGRETAADVARKRNSLRTDDDRHTEKNSILAPATINENNGDPMGSPVAPTSPEPLVTSTLKPPVSLGGSAPGPVFGFTSVPTKESVDPSQTFKFSSVPDMNPLPLAGGPFSGPSFVAQSAPDNLSTFVFGAASKPQTAAKLPTPSFGFSDSKPSSSPTFAFGGSSAAGVSKDLSNGPATTPVFGAGSSGNSLFSTGTPGFSAIGASPFGKSDTGIGTTSTTANQTPSAFSAPVSGALFGAPATPSFGAGIPSFGSGPPSGNTPSYGASAPAFGISSSAITMSSSAFISSTPTPEVSFGGNSILGTSMPSFSGGSSFGATTAAFGSGPNISMSTPIFGTSTPAFGSSSAPIFGGTSPSFGANSSSLGANAGSFPAGPIFAGFGSSNATPSNTGMPSDSALPSGGQSGSINFNSGATAANSAFAIGSTQTNGNTSRRRFIRAKRMHR